jgi:Zn-finger nucleic acid-binding protein
MKCPIDQTELRVQNYEADIDVGACPSCGGMWLEKGELEAIEDVREHDYTEELARMPDLGYRAYDFALAKGGRVLRCPKCARDMEAREYARCSQVMIDVCPSCHGIWLDKGELESLEVFFERSRFEAGEIRRGFLFSLRSVFD